jgi:HSP20 family protein
MKNEVIPVRKDVRIAVKPVNADNIFAQVTEWTNRIAKRAFELFQGRGFADGHHLDDWFAAERELLMPVALEVNDTTDDFVVRVQTPGFEAKDLDIQVDGSRLLIQGKQETTHENKEKDKAITTETRTQQIYQVIELPAPVQAEKARAELKNGVLELSLPKAKKAIDIKAVAA